jgi:adenosyl cobinamide kinase/adenosyl cobinamide phosphate guanylyltransferase
MILNDIEFHYGFRKCGKSEHVEQMLKQYKTKVYFGTLPFTSKYFSTINEHVQRRGTDWLTINVNHDLKSDLTLISKTLSELPSTSVAMIDGLWTWYIFTNKNKTINPAEFAYSICQIIKKKFDVLKIVDIGTYIFDNNNHDKKKIEILHNVLITELEIKKLIDYRYEKF